MASKAHTTSAEGSKGDTGRSTSALQSLADIGDHLRAARLEKEISLREMARRIEVSPSFVSQVELGKAKPSLGTLYSFVSELGLSLDELMPSGQAPGQERIRDETVDALPPVGTASGIPWTAPASPVQRGATRRMVQLTGVTWQRLTSHDDPLVDFLHVTYEPRAESCPPERLMRHSGIEYGFITAGRMSVQVGFEYYELAAGDSISFDSGIPHRLSNDGDVTCTSVWVVVGRRHMPSATYDASPHHPG